MIPHFGLLAIAAIAWIANGQSSNCPECTKPGIADTCTKAIQRWEANGIFDTNGPESIVRTAHSGDLTCVAQMRCDSSGGHHRFVGNDVRKWFAALKPACGVCGDTNVPTASNCWLQIIACQNCDVPESGKPIGFLSSSTKQAAPPATSKKPTINSSKRSTIQTTTKKSTVSPSKSPAPPPTTKKSTTTPRTTKAPAPPSSKKTSKPSAPPSSKKTTKPQLPPTTTKKPNEPSPTPKPQPDQEEKDTGDAENANDNYQKDPTNGSLASKLRDAVKKALDSVKKAVDNAVNESVKGAELGLQHALEDALAAAATAAAGPSAAAAAAAAAAMKGVSAAKDALKKAKQNKPTKTPTKGPTTRFTKSTHTTSIISSSSSTCVCLKCGLDRVDSEPAPEEKRSTFHLSNTREMRKTLQRASTRQATICNLRWNVPEYISWSSTGGNTYSPFYDSSYTMNMISCADINFGLVRPAGGYPGMPYATEHVYEIQMVAQFLTYMWQNDPAIGAWKAHPQNLLKTECDLWDGFLWRDSNDIAWWDESFFDGKHLIEHVLEKLSGSARNTEMVYLRAGINSIKGVMFGGSMSQTWNKWEDQLAQATDTATLIFYLQDNHVRNIYHNVSRRMHNVWGLIDGELNDEQKDPDLRLINFAGGYLRWEAQFLEGLENRWSTRPGSQAKLAEDELRRGSSTVKTRVANDIKTERISLTGKLNPVNLHFAQGLLSWFPGPRP